MKKNLIGLLLFLCGGVCVAAEEYSFADYVSDTGLTGDETAIIARKKSITDLNGLAGNFQYLATLVIEDNSIGSIGNGDFEGLSNLSMLLLDGNAIANIDADGFYGSGNLQILGLDSNQLTCVRAGDFASLNNLQSLGLRQNRISYIERGSFSNLNSLQHLYLKSNQLAKVTAKDFEELGSLEILDLSYNNITIIEDKAFSFSSTLGVLDISGNKELNVLNLTGANFGSLARFSVEECSIESVFLRSVLFNQVSFDAIFNGCSVDPYHYSGIAEVSGVRLLDLSFADFTEVLDLSEMYGMNDLKELVFTGVFGLSGYEVVELLGELDSLCYLDVSGVFGDWDSGIQSQLTAWDDIEGNVLVVPEPASLLLLGLGFLAVRGK